MRAGAAFSGAEHRVARLVHDGNGDDFLIAKADQDFAQAVLGFRGFKARGGKLCRGQARRKFIDAVNSRDFFDQIHFARHIAAPGRLPALPRGRGANLRCRV